MKIGSLLRGATLLLAGGIWTSTAASSQSYPAHVYTQADGLPALIIESIEQSSDGYIWIASRAGLTSYDGLHWQSWRTDVLEEEEYLLLENDDFGRLWAVAADFSIVFRERSEDQDPQWNVFPAPITEPLSSDRPVDLAILSGPEGPEHLALSTEFGRLHLWNRDSGWTLRNSPAETNPLFVYDVERFGDEFLLAADRGLLRVDGHPVESIPPGAVYALHRASNEQGEETLWLLGSSWTGSYKPEEGFTLLSEIETIPLRGRPPRLSTDGLGGVVFGNTQFAIRVAADGRREFFGRRSGLAAEGLTDLLRDREGNLWISSLRGLSKIVRLNNSTWNEQHGLLADEVSAVLELNSGRFLIGQNPGVVLLDPGRSTPNSQIVWSLEFASLPEIDIQDLSRPVRALDMIERDDGDVWIAAGYGGLLHLSPDGTVRGHWTFKEEISGVVVDSEGVLWFVSGDRLYRFDEEPVFVRRLPQAVRRLFLGSNGDLYGAALKGLLHVRPPFDVSEVALYPAPPRSGSVFALIERENRLLVGTNAGLFEVRDETLRRSDSPRVRRPIYVLFQDRKEHLWIGTDRGALRWDGESLKSYTEREGMAGAETNRAAGLVDSQGRIWIGTEGGVNRLIDEPMPTPPAPLVEIDRIEVDDEVFSPRSPLRLANRRNHLYFHYRALSFRDEQRIRFRVRLEGFEDVPLELRHNDRWSRYTNLPQGTYRFEVQAAAPDGPWSPVVHTETIRIAPPFWFRPWFLSLTLLLAAGAFVLLRRDLLQRRRIAAEIAKSQRLDSLGRLAGGLAHDFNNLLTAVLGQISLAELYLAQRYREDEPPEIRRHLSQARKATERAGELTRQLVTFARGGAPVKRPTPLRDFLLDTIGGALAESSVQAEIDLDEDLLGAEVDAGQFRQALHNLVAHAAGVTPKEHSILVRASNLEDESAVLIEVVDQGGEISHEDRDHLFEPYFMKLSKGRGLGLAATYSIVRAHGGDLRVESTAAGSHFSLFLPAIQMPEKSRTGTDELLTGEQGSIRVLVMDDEAMVREVITKALTSLNYDVTATSRGEDAVVEFRKAAADRPFDVVVLDLVVAGGLGGRDTLKELVKIDPDVRAVVCSGYSHDPVMANFRDYGFCGVLPKPFQIRRLDETLQEALEEKRASMSGQQS